MLISHSPNGLIVFCHVLLTYPYRPAGESLVLQTWRMSEPFAPDPLDEKIVSLPAEIQGERLHIISLMTRLPENNFGPLALLNVYAAGTDMVTRVPVERFDIDLYYMADKHGALGMGLSYIIPRCVLCGKSRSTTLTMSSSRLGKTLSLAFGPSFVRVRSLRSSCVSCFYFWLRTGLRSGMAVFWAFAVIWPFHFVVVLYCLCGIARPLFSCSLLRCLLLLGGSDVFPGLG